jgi:hypothetical protein
MGMLQPTQVKGIRASPEPKFIARHDEQVA